MQPDDQIGIIARRLRLVSLKLVQQRLNPIDGRQHEGHGVPGHRPAAPKRAHQSLGGMGERLETRQPQKAACAFDGVYEPKDVLENFDVVRLLLEAHELYVDELEIFACLRQELAQQVVHGSGSLSTQYATCPSEDWRGTPVCYETV